MENQHRKIKGYRDLSQTEIDLMNEIKTKGIELNELVAKVQQYLANEKNSKETAAATTYSFSETEVGTVLDSASVASIEAVEELQRFNAAEPLRWAAIAKTDFQTGLMALTRSVAQPGFF